MTEDEIKAILRAAGAEYRHMGRGVNAWCMGGDLMPMIEALLAAKAAPVAPAEPAEGWVLVPKRMTQEMRDVTDSEGWTWEDLLAEAGSISQEEYAAIAAAIAAAPEGAGMSHEVDNDSFLDGLQTVASELDQLRTENEALRARCAHLEIALLRLIRASVKASEDAQFLRRVIPEPKTSWFDRLFKN